MPVHAISGSRWAMRVSIVAWLPPTRECGCRRDGVAERCFTRRCSSLVWEGAHSVWRGSRPNTCSLRRYDPDQVRRVHRIGISGKGHPAGAVSLAQATPRTLASWAPFAGESDYLFGSLSQCCKVTFVKIHSHLTICLACPRMMWDPQGLDARPQ